MYAEKIICMSRKSVRYLKLCFFRYFMRFSKNFLLICENKRLNNIYIFPLKTWDRLRDVGARSVICVIGIYVMVGKH